MIPAHLFISLWIEVWAAHKARKIKAGKQDPKKMERKGSWGLIRFTHIVNIGICLGVTSVAVYTMVYHPLLGMICEMHAGTLPIFLSRLSSCLCPSLSRRYSQLFHLRADLSVVIVALKVASYALTNRDLRDMYLESIPTPEEYKLAPYPENIKLSNLLYFWWAPTLIYQPVYPRTDRFRWSFFLKRSGEAIGILIALWFIIAQYATSVHPHLPIFILSEFPFPH